MRRSSWIPFLLLVPAACVDPAGSPETAIGSTSGLTDGAETGAAAADVPRAEEPQGVAPVSAAPRTSEAKPSGFDAASCPGGQTVVLGTNNADVKFTTSGNRCVVGLGGNDVLTHGGSSPTAARTTLAGPGNDTVSVSANTGNHLIDLWTGNDSLLLGSGTNEVYGDAGDDTIATGAGADTIFAGPGQDVVSIAGSPDYVDLGDGDDVAYAGAGADTILGGAGNDVFSGGAGAGHLEGNAGNDVIGGGSGSETILPGPGLDVIHAGAGNDTVIVYDPCEVQSGEILDGGDGAGDTLVTPIPVAELQALGVTVSGFEHFTVQPGSCQSECVEPPECSGHGVCAEGSGPGEVVCDCEDGYSGEDCSVVGGTTSSSSGGGETSSGGSASGGDGGGEASSSSSSGGESSSSSSSSSSSGGESSSSSSSSGGGEESSSSSSTSGGGEASSSSSSSGGDETSSDSGAETTSGPGTSDGGNEATDDDGGTTGAEAGSSTSTTGDGESSSGGSGEPSPAPPLDRTISTSPHDMMRFLFEGPGARQEGVAPGTIEPKRIAMLHGSVHDDDGPLGDVQVSVLGHPEFGSTRTLATGEYHLVVNGGEEYTVAFESTAHLPVHRAAISKWNETHEVPDVVMVEVDPVVTPIAFPGPTQVHRGSIASDASGSRQATLIFQPDTEASLSFAGGVVQPASTLAIRTTEYTEGTNGLRRMPAVLPPGTEYTYALEITADESEAAGAESVLLDPPAALYLENFLDLPVGLFVPAGSYDRNLGLWAGDEDGRVIEILGSSSGLADIDLDGSGTPATEEQLAIFGITDAERQELVSLYEPGTELWRAPIRHFTPVDLNLAGRTPPGAEAPPDVDAEENQDEDDPCNKSGSIIECENQTLGERVAVTGTPYTLNWRSSRTASAANRSLRLPVTLDEVPESLRRARVRVEIAGRTIEETFTNAPNQTYDFRWDGRDAFGRLMQGPQPINICTSYDYPLLYSGANAGVPRSRFGQWLDEGVVVPGRDDSEISLVKCYARGAFSGATNLGGINKANRYRLGGLDARAVSDALGGWTLDVHHTLARETSTLYLGNGEKRDLTRDKVWMVQRVAGTGFFNGPFTGPDARGVAFPAPRSLALAPNGDLYVASSGAVRRIRPSGAVEAFAGDGVPGFSGDGGPALSARLSGEIVAIDFGFGGVVIADAGNGRIRVVKNGVIDTLIGSGETACSTIDHGVNDPATVSLAGLVDFKDGMWVQNCGSTNRIRKFRYERDEDSGEVFPVIDHVAGWPYPSFIDANRRPVIDCPVPPNNPGDIFGWDFRIAGDSNSKGTFGPEWAILSSPHALAKGENGGFYVAEGSGASGEWDRRIRSLEGRGVSTYEQRYEIKVDDEGRWPCNNTGCTWTVKHGGDHIDEVISALTNSSDGLVYAIESFSSQVFAPYARRQFRLAGGGGVMLRGQTIETSVQQYRLSRATDLEAGDDGSLYLTDQSQDVVVRIGMAAPSLYEASAVAAEDGSEYYVFDENGRHIETRDAWTDELIRSFGYDGHGRLIAVNAQQGTTTILRGGNGLAQAVVSADGVRTDLVHDGAGNLIATVGPDGARHEFDYDTEARVVAARTPEGGEHMYTYGPDGRLQSDRDPTGNEQELVRAQVNGDTYRVTHESRAGRVSTYEVRRARGEGSTRRNTAPDGSVTETLAGEGSGGYNRTLANGVRIDRNVYPDARLGVNAPVTISLNVDLPSGRRLTVNSNRQHVPYCQNFQPCEDLPIDRIATYRADEIREEINIDPDPPSRKTFKRARTENGVERPAEVVFATPVGRTTKHELGVRGRVERIENAGTLPTILEYDGRDRPIRIVQGTGGTARTLEMTWDQFGEVDTFTDALDRTVRMERGSHGRVTRMVEADGRDSIIDYDANGNISSIDVPTGARHQFTYDENDRLIAYAPPETQAGLGPTTYAYGADDDIELVTRPDGLEIDPEYEPVSGMLAALHTPEGSHAYSYDSAGRLEQATDPDGGTLSYAYDGSLILSETYAGDVSGIVTVAYDTKLRPGSQSAAGVSVTLGYDADDLLTAAGAETLTRATATGGVQETHLGTIDTTHVYDAFGDVETVTYEGSSATIYETSYARDVLGRVSTEAETLDGVERMRTYVYDTAGRLIRVHSGSDAMGPLLEEYAYDDNGNRLHAMNSSGTVTSAEIELDAQDRLLTYGDFVYSYTENGELDLKTNTATDETWDFDYDVLGNLRRVQLPNGDDIDYVVDARNRRIGKRVNGALVQGFLYGSQTAVLAELDGAGALVSRFVYASRGNVPDYMIKAGTTYRIVSDFRGSVVAVVDAATGAIVQKMEYDAWGSVLEDTNPGFQPFGFAGGIYDLNTHLTRFGARDYDSPTGRWTLKDPIGFGGEDANLYAYGLNDPINLIDHDGLLFGGALDLGEDYGESAVEYWVDIYNNSEGPAAWGAAALGGLASLWTPCTSDATLTVLSSAAGIAAVARGIQPGGWMNANRYLRIGWGRRGGDRVFRAAGDLVKKFRSKGKIDFFDAGPL